MRETRNPFLLSASEDIESDEMFLRLFEPAMLDLLPSEQLWDKACIFRSTPGGGKTSLLRLFTPQVLTALYTLRNKKSCKDLYTRLRSLGVIGEEGPLLLGIMLPCRTYATIFNMELDEARQEQLFYGLLNARMVLAALKGAAALQKFEFPKDVQQLTVKPLCEMEIPLGLQFPCKGNFLYEWAKKVEIDIYDMLSSFSTPQPDSLPGHDSIESLPLVRPGCLTFNEVPIAKRTLVMFDDMHELTTHQREKLLPILIELHKLHSPVGIWVAERSNEPSADQMFAPGKTPGQDYDGVLLIEKIEKFWRDKSKKRQFEKSLINIAERRVREVMSVEIDSFASCLQASLEEPGEEHIKAVVQRVHALVEGTPIYQDWVTARDRMKGTPTERLRAWRALEILITRKKRKEQQVFDFLLSIDELKKKDGSDVREAAGLFLARELSLPYYFGPERLALLASSNIKQFLRLAGDQFEEVLAVEFLKRPVALHPVRQEAIIQKAVDQRWEEIPQRVQNGWEVRKFLLAIGEFAKPVTYQSNAPYSPGVTGIAISMADRDRLYETRARTETGSFQRLAEVIDSAIEYNLLEPIPNYKVKGRLCMVLYLNRALCVKFALPLGYGGFREQKLTELSQWLEHGFQPKKEASLP